MIFDIYMKFKHSHQSTGDRSLATVNRSRSPRQAALLLVSHEMAAHDTTVGSRPIPRVRLAPSSYRPFHFRQSRSRLAPRYSAPVFVRQPWALNCRALALPDNPRASSLSTSAMRSAGGSLPVSDTPHCSAFGLRLGTSASVKVSGPGTGTGACVWAWTRGCPCCGPRVFHRLAQ